MALVLAFAVLPHARAADDCSSPVTAELRACESGRFNAAQTELDKTYAEAQAALKGRIAEPFLRQSQQAWRAYRDAQCKLDAAGNEGGTIQPIVQLVCMEQMTRSRVAEIRAEIQCGPGQINCAAMAPFVWDGEWRSGTALMVTVEEGKVAAFYWHDDYQKVGATSVADDGLRLTWPGGSVRLDGLRNGRAYAVVTEGGRQTRLPLTR
jgi:uncharacterized protein YecT (DUF1311 family)